MTNLEQRMKELKAEVELCKLAMRMQARIGQIESSEKRDLFHARKLIEMLQGAKQTFNFATPKHGCIPIYWKEWVQEWNLFCYRHNKDRYILYVHSN